MFVQVFTGISHASVFGIMLCANFYSAATIISEKNLSSTRAKRKKKTWDYQNKMQLLVCPSWGWNEILLSSLSVSRFYKDGHHDRLHPNL